MTDMELRIPRSEDEFEAYGAMYAWESEAEYEQVRRAWQRREAVTMRCDDETLDESIFVLAMRSHPEVWVAWMPDPAKALMEFLEWNAGELDAMRKGERARRLQTLIGGGALSSVLRAVPSVHQEPAPLSALLSACAGRRREARELIEDLHALDLVDGYCDGGLRMGGSDVWMHYRWAGG